MGLQQEWSDYTKSSNSCASKYTIYHSTRKLQWEKGYSDKVRVDTSCRTNRFNYVFVHSSLIISQSVTSLRKMPYENTMENGGNGGNQHFIYSITCIKRPLKGSNENGLTAGGL